MTVACIARSHHTPAAEGFRGERGRGRCRCVGDSRKRAPSPSRWRWPASSQSSPAGAAPPKSVAAAPGVNAEAVAAPAVPTFVNGLSQNVFSATDVITGEVWVESDFDSDLDGKKDRLHADFTLPRETQTDGLKVPVIYEDSPYYAGTGGARNWLVDHELGATVDPPRAGVLQRHEHEPEHLQRPRGDLAAARLRRRALRVPGLGLQRRLPDLRRPERDARRHGDHRLAQRPQEGLHDARRRRRGRARQLAQRQDGDDGHVLQRHDPDRRRVNRR